MIGIWKQTVPAINPETARVFVKRYFGGHDCDYKKYEARWLRNERCGGHSATLQFGAAVDL